MPAVNISDSEVNAINATSIAFISIWCYLMIIFGLIGHILSIGVFTRPSLRSNPCSCYFLAATISAIGLVAINVLLRLLQTVYKINIYMGSVTICKFLSWLFLWIKIQHGWFIALASIDRSSSTSYRLLSSLRVAYRTIPLTSLIVGLAHVHVLIYFRINVKQQTCVPLQGIYQEFFGAWYLVTFSLTAPMFMLFFGLSTVRNIRQSIRRVGQHNIQIPIPLHQLRKKIDRQMIEMMLVQCIVFIFTASLPAVYFFYTSFRSNVTVDTLQLAKDNLLYNITGFLSLTVPCMSFYLFTLSSKLFRNELIKLLSGHWQSLKTIAINIALS
ncbi:unnamed protein product [Rotaria sp. Silwood2]|nr:unnamed protein product [Rotaria sp. Silwood2]